MNKIPDNINIKKIVPSFTMVVTTMEKYSKDGLNEFGLIDPTKSQGTLKEFQYVTAVGPNVRSCKPGDLVKVNPSRYAVYKQRQTPNISDEIEGYSRQLTGYSFNTVEIAGERHLILQDNDIEYVVEEFENIDPPLLLSNPTSVITN